MRFYLTLLNDIRYQVKYGFYFLYAFISAIYITILLVCPMEYRKTAASIIILSDPAMLGSFFIGGIWLLEKSEGIHKYWGISPLRPMEYILSKVISLALISAIVANLIAAIGLKHDVNYIVLSLSTFLGSMVFTTIGLFVATYTRSVNQYITFMSPFVTIITVPPILAALGISHPAIDIFAGTALWHYIFYSIGGTRNIGIWPCIILLLWLGVAFFIVNKRMPLALQVEGGEKI